MAKNKLVKRYEVMQEEVRRKRTVAGVLNYGIVAFGPEKKDYFVRLTKKALLENRYFTVRYLALIDMFVILGVVLWFLGYRYGFELALIAFLVAVIVFVDARELEKRSRMAGRIVAKPVKQTVEAVSKVAKVSAKKTVSAVKKTHKKLKKMVE